MGKHSQIVNALEAIETKLFDNISIDSIADAAHLSPFHFSRLFKSLTGDSVMAYVKKRRLTIAAERLAKEKTAIIAIAVDCGFESHEVFCRAFKQMTGVTPSAFRAENKPFWLVSCPPLTPEHLTHIGLHLTKQPRYCEVEPFVVSGLSQAFTQSTRQDIPELWGQLLALDEISLTSKQPFLGVSSLSQPWEFDYTAGVKSKTAINHRAAVQHTIPGGTYAVFSHSGPVDTLAASVAYIWGTWYNTTKDTILESPDFELYPTLNPLPECIDIYIPVIPR